MGAHIFPWSSSYYSEDKVRLEPVTLMQPQGADRVGVARAHNLLSSAEYILYTTQYSSLTL